MSEPGMGEDVVRMANQIAAFFAPYPRDEAVAGVAGHITSFWTPAMRARLLALAASTDGLHDLVRAALPRLG